jgi:ferredoxin
MKTTGTISLVLSALTWLLTFAVATHGFGIGIPSTISKLRQQDSRRYMSEENEHQQDDRIDLALDPRLYRIRLPRAPGIEWSTDLSFSFVYVRDMDPSGPAAISGKVQKGDQLCELIPIAEENNKPINLMGAPFDFVMSAFGGLEKTTKDVDLVFFRGTKDELKAACSGDGSEAVDPETVTITVIVNKGSPEENVQTLTAPTGVNVRQLLVDNGINVYQSVTRWTNCKGKQLCGTCIVNVSGGSINTNRKSMDEGSTLRENPESYRLSCVTFAYGDVTVETFPPINAAQWTR